MIEIGPNLKDLILAGLAIVLCMIQFVRLNLLSKEIGRIVDDVYEKRMAGYKNNLSYDECVAANPYPDIDATYDNLKWTTFWRRPSTLIVFNKEKVY